MLARTLAWMLLAAPLLAAAAGDVKLDRMPADVNPNDPVSLQRGAQVYVNYCLGCHGASYMRYNRLQDLGLTEQQIRDNLILTGAKVGELMKTGDGPEGIEGMVWDFAAGPDRDRALPRLWRRQRRGLALHLSARLLPRPFAPDRLEQHGFPERRHAARALCSCKASRS